MSFNQQRLAVFPTPMVLTVMKSKLLAARNGHGLLKKKADALSIRLKTVVSMVKKAKQDMFQAAQLSICSLIQLTYSIGDIGFAARENARVAGLKVKGKIENVAGIQTWNLEAYQDGPGICELSGLGKGRKQIHQCRDAYTELISQAVRIASLQAEIQILHTSISATSRRVNAIDCIVIPQYELTISYITSELDELSREDFYRLKKIQKIKKANKNLPLESDDLQNILSSSMVQSLHIEEEMDILF